MKIDETASKEIENFTKKILEQLDIPKLEKENIRQEFSSHVYESAREIAQKRNSDVVEIEDVESAKDDMESIEGIASSLAKSYADSLKRVGFKERFIAYVIDLNSDNVPPTLPIVSPPSKDLSSQFSLTCPG